MAEAILGGMVESEFVPEDGVHIFDVNTKRLAHYNARWPGMISYDSAGDAVQGADVLLLAVKPQHMADALDEVASSVTADTLVVSIAAGVTLGRLAHALPQAKSIVRTMPNTPAMIRQGMSVWCGTKAVSDSQKDLSKRLLRCFGEEHFVTDETSLDVATAIVGSGPAYTFMFIEAQIDTAVHMGFPRDVAESLVLETVKGSANYFEASGTHIARLRNDITSPGGTTAAALYELDRLGFKHTISDALWASYRRSLELGGMDSRVGPGRSKGVMQQELPAAQSAPSRKVLRSESRVTTMPDGVNDNDLLARALAEQKKRFMAATDSMGSLWKKKK